MTLRSKTGTSQCAELVERIRIDSRGQVTRLHLYLLVVALTSSTCRGWGGDGGRGTTAARLCFGSARNVMMLRWRWLKAPASSNSDGRTDGGTRRSSPIHDNSFPFFRCHTLHMRTTTTREEKSGGTDVSLRHDLFSTCMMSLLQNTWRLDIHTYIHTDIDRTVDIFLIVRHATTMIYIRVRVS